VWAREFLKRNIKDVATRSEELTNKYPTNDIFELMGKVG